MTTINGYEIAGRMPLFQKWGRDAIREGRKTQTRRPIKPQPDNHGYWQHPAGHKVHKYDLPLCAPYQPGDIRVMTEPLIRDGEFANYADDDSCCAENQTDGNLEWRWKRDTLAAMYMPHEAARTLCRITEVRAERLQDISEGDAEAEGMDGHCPEDQLTWATPREQFSKVWDTIYKAPFIWSNNHWVWVYGFEGL